MKSIVIAGRLGKDAELRRTQNGDPVLGFNVAVDDGYGQNKRTLWFRCSVWGKRAEALADHLKKGSAVAVAGDLSTDEYEGKTSLTVRVNEVTLQGGKSEGQSQQRSSGAKQQSYGEQSGGSYGGGRDLDDDIPFSPEWR